MIKVATLTTVYGRPRITNFHFHWMSWFKFQCSKLGVDLIPFYVLSEDDDCLDIFKEELFRLGHSHTIRPVERLSVKSQAGLEALRDKHDFDWLMHLDSDEILSLGLLKKWKKEWEDKIALYFGSASCYFFHLKTHQAWEFLRYPDHPIKNGGTCIHKEILDVAQWQLWPFQRNQGLNVMERERLEKVGYRPAAIDVQDVYGVVEIKGGEKAIHNLDWFLERDLARHLTNKEYEELFNHYPMLRNSL